MRKLCLLLVFLVPGLLLSAPIVPNTQGFNMVGYVGKSVNLSITLDDTEMYRQSQVWSFDMLDPRVQRLEGASLINGTGFRFASWSLTYNSNQIILRVSHDELQNEADLTKSVDYALAIECSKTAFNLGETYKFGKIVLANEVVSIDFSTFGDPNQIAINNYGLFIRLNATKADINDLPDGVYFSTINLEVVSV